jgi:hypothetical protein
VANFTSGPWNTKIETDYVPAQVWADGRQLAEVYGEDRATRARNALMMAAAPELFEAVERLLSNDGIANRDFARAALKKAGEVSRG